MIKKRILVNIEFDRTDHLKIFGSMLEDFEFIFLGYHKGNSMNISTYSKKGKVLFWSDYKDAFELISQINPTKIIFFHFETFHQIALLAAAKQCNIKTYHLEHSIRIENLQKDLIDHEKNNYSISLILKKALNISKIGYLKNSFYRKTAKKTGKKLSVFLKKFFQLRFYNGISTTYEILKKGMLVPDHFIGFNKNTLDFHLNRHGFSKEDILHSLIGLPQYDDFRNIVSSKISMNNYVILIDQPFVEQSLFGWTIKNKNKFLDELEIIIGKNDLLIKPHPLNNLNLYPKKFRLIDDIDFRAAIDKSEIIIGFYSTLLIPLASIQHLTLFSFENHPDPPKSKMSAPFLAAGISKEVISVNDLQENLLDLATIKKNQNFNKETFIQDWLFTFDGQAGLRLKSLLLE